jgi:hypothetical protein
MNALTKLALFALLLATVFALAAGLGALVDSGGSTPRPTTSSTQAQAHAGHPR